MEYCARLGLHRESGIRVEGVLNVQCPSVLLLTFELNLIILHCSKYSNKKSDNQMLRCREVYSKLISRLFAGPIRAYDHMNCFLQNDPKQTIDD